MSRVNRALCDPVTPRTERLSDFDSKNVILAKIKLAARQELRRHNQLRLRYRDWFKRRSQSVLGTLRTVHILGRQLAPKQVFSIADFFRVCAVGRQLTNSGMRIDGLDSLDEYTVFWFELRSLLKDFQLRVRDPVAAFTASVTALRQPDVKAEFDELCEMLEKRVDEDFSFDDIHNTRDNLFTYGVDIRNECYLGLMQFIPHLADIFSKTCFLVQNLHIEKV